MLDKLIKYVPITTAIILYLFLCGGLYLIGFWTTFDVDILSLVSIMEIPKSFILPFSLSMGAELFFLFIFLLLAHDKKIAPSFFELNYMRLRAQKKLIYKLDFWILVLTISIIIFFNSLQKSPLFWIFSCSAILFMISIKIIRYRPFFKTYLSFNKTLLMIYLSVFYTPVLSLMLGKVSSLIIYNNIEVKYIKNIIVNNNKDILAQKDSLSFKSLGFLGDKFIISSLDNKEIIILNQASIQQIDFVDKK